MSRAWKWILGIVGVLIILAVVAGGVWLLANRASRIAAVRPFAAQPNNQTAPFGPNGQYFPNGRRGFGNDGRGPFGGNGFRGPMMGNRFLGFGPFGMGMFFLGGLLRLIVPLGLFVLVAFIFYQLGKRAGVSSTARSQPAPVTPTPPDQNPPSAA